MHVSHQAKAVFPPGPMILFRSVRKISCYLVRAKLYPLKRSVGSRHFKKRRCKVGTNVTLTYTFSSPFR